MAKQSALDKSNDEFAVNNVTALAGSQTAPVATPKPKKLRVVKTDSSAWVVRSYKIRAETAQLVERAAYWNHLDKREIVDRALREYLADKKTKPIPTKQDIV